MLNTKINIFYMDRFLVLTTHFDNLRSNQIFSNITQVSITFPFLRTCFVSPRWRHATSQRCPPLKIFHYQKTPTCNQSTKVSLMITLGLNCLYESKAIFSFITSQWNSFKFSLHIYEYVPYILKNMTCNRYILGL